MVSIAGAPELGRSPCCTDQATRLLSRTWVADFCGRQSVWERCLLRLATVRGWHDPGVTRAFKKAINNRDAYAASVRTVLAWDFDRIIVGHGTTILRNGREASRRPGGRGSGKFLGRRGPFGPVKVFQLGTDHGDKMFGQMPGRKFCAERSSLAGPKGRSRRVPSPPRPAAGA